MSFYLYGHGRPRLFLSAGLHGDEATTIYALQRVIEFLDSQGLARGTVKILPIGHPAAFRRLRRTSPFDELDLNRVFPGKDTSVTQALAAAIWEEALDADYLVDLHCSGIWGACYTLAMWQEFTSVRELAGRIALPHVVQSYGTRGQLFVEACHAGIAGLVIEVPGGGDPGGIDLRGVEGCFGALMNLLRSLGMVKGEAEASPPLFLERMVPVTADGDGVFLPAVQPGARVGEGEALGRLADRVVSAPRKGLATMILPPAFIFRGTAIASIAPLP